MIVVGMQLVLTLGEIRKSFKTNGLKSEKVNKNKVDFKKSFDKKKYSGVHSVIDKMRILSHLSHSKRKKFFVKDK